MWEILRSNGSVSRFRSSWVAERPWIHTILFTSRASCFLKFKVTYFCVFIWKVSSVCEGLANSSPQHTTLVNWGHLTNIFTALWFNNLVGRIYVSICSSCKSMEIVMAHFYLSKINHLVFSWNLHILKSKYFGTFCEDFKSGCSLVR